VCFYDAIHPAIARHGLIAALFAMFFLLMIIVIGMYSNYADLVDFNLAFLGKFEVNAKSLLFNCVQNMILMCFMQSLKRFMFPNHFTMVISKVELKTMNKGIFDVVSRNNISMKDMKSSKE
jgi:hypothetical protein